MSYNNVPAGKIAIVLDGAILDIVAANSARQALAIYAENSGLFAGAERPADFEDYSFYVVPADFDGSELIETATAVKAEEGDPGLFMTDAVKKALRDHVETFIDGTREYRRDQGDEEAVTEWVDIEDEKATDDVLVKLPGYIKMAGLPSRTHPSFKLDSDLRSVVDMYCEDALQELLAK